jgi:hypothetical protein
MGRIATLVCVVVACSGLTAIASATSQTGDRHADKIVGTTGADTLKGLAGNDRLIGGRGRDVLIGGKGADVLRGGRGRDSYNMRDGIQLSAPGDDRIHARDSIRDQINCGSGTDVAFVDSEEDGVYDCEKVIAR